MNSEYYNSTIDWFFNEEDQWQSCFQKLREIIMTQDLSESLKWGVPCYTAEEKNIVLMHGFKEYCAILFMKGSLMSDPAAILVQQTENVQSSRQIRFTSLDEVVQLEDTIKAYVKEAMAIEKSGQKVAFKKASEYPVPEELEAYFASRPELKTAFEGLTPGRQRGYLLHFGSAKQAKTRISRIEKFIPHILVGKGMDD